MKDFGRVLKLAARRRFAIAGILLSSLMIAVLWGANISVLYPLVEIVFEGDGLPDYAEQQLAASRAKIDDLRLEKQSLEDQLATVEKSRQPAIQSDLRFINSRLGRAIKVESWWAWGQPIIAKYAPSGPFQTLLLIVGVLVFGTALKLIALVINLLLVQYVSEKTALQLRSNFFRKALRLDLDSFGENGSAHLTSRLTNDTSHVSAGLSILLGRLVREPLKMIVCLGSAALVCPRLLLLVMVVTPVIATVMQYLSKAIRRASRKAMEEMSQLYGLLNNAFSGIRVVKAFNTQAYERAKFRRGTAAFYRKSLKVAFYNSLARSTSEMLGMTTVGLAILAGGYLVVNGQVHLFGLRMSEDPLSQGEILLFFAFLIGATDPARKLTDVWSGLQRGIAATKRVYEVIDQPVRVKDPKNPRSPPAPSQGNQLRQSCLPISVRTNRVTRN